MERVPALDSVGEVSRFVCLQWETGGSARERHDSDGEGEDRDAVAAREWSEAVPF